MPQEEGKNSRGNSEEHDTDERFQDHPELAPREDRISVEKVKNLDEEARKRGLHEAPVEDAGDRHRKIDLNFDRNHDFAGNEKSLPTDADESHSRGSGFLGGKLVGEGSPGEGKPVQTDAGGIPPSEKQSRNIEAIRREEEERGIHDWTPHPTDSPSVESQVRDEKYVRDVPMPPQVTGTQSFGRDIGAAGLTQEDREERTMGPGKSPPTQEQKLWAAILRRLGGSSPGSEENLQLADLFAKVQFPADRNGVISRLEPGAEFRLREGITVDLRQAVERSRAKTFRNIGDLVDCVKDELRRQESDGVKLMKMA